MIIAAAENMAKPGRARRLGYTHTPLGDPGYNP